MAVTSAEAVAATLVEVVATTEVVRNGSETAVERCAQQRRGTAQRRVWRGGASTEEGGVKSSRTAAGANGCTTPASESGLHVAWGRTQMSATGGAVLSSLARLKLL